MMRITNGMMMNTTKLNINNNKVSVDRLNTQMSTQKKITKPSDNPLIAIKSLRLSTTLSQIQQYYGNNIKDANSWMDVTETALTNMKDIFTDAYRLCVNGSTDTLTEEDRKTILEQLKGLSNQLYAEANADYAERTVFSGYKTNSTVSFTNGSEAALAKYAITESLDSSKIETYTYYANKLDTPTYDEVDHPLNPDNKWGTPAEEILKRMRLSYGKLSDLSSFSYNYKVDTSSSASNATTSGNVTITHDMVGDPGATPPLTPPLQNFQWRSLQKDSAFTYYADSTGKMMGTNPDKGTIGATFEDMNGYTMKIGNDGRLTTDNTDLKTTARTTKLNGVTTRITTYSDEKGNMIFTTQEEDYTTAATPINEVRGTIIDAQGNRITFTRTPPLNLATPPAASGSNMISITDAQGNSINTNMTGGGSTITVTNADGNTALTATANANAYTVHTADKNLTTDLKVQTMTSQDFEAYLTSLAATPDVVKNKYKDTIIYLPDSGELVLGQNLAQNFTSEYASFEVNYEKNGFSKGETRPEMYFNCTNKSDESPANWITYTNYDADGNWIAQDINYAISANQDMRINTQIRDVANADCFRDLAELTDIVQQTIDAHTTVANIEGMMKSGDYPEQDKQNYLTDCLEKAKKQMAYLDDHLQKVFGSQISHFENYLGKVNLAITDIGSRGDQLALAENRMSSQKTTFTELKSNNEDEELSDVTIDYTSAFTAFQASLQAAGKIDDMSLLDYL